MFLKNNPIFFCPSVKTLIVSEVPRSVRSVTFVSRGGLEELQFYVKMAWLLPFNLQITNPEEIKVCVHEANARIEIGMTMCDYTSILMDYLRNGPPPQPPE